MNAQLSAAWNTAEQSRWEGLDAQLHAVGELLQAIKHAKLDTVCDESGCVSKSLPLIKPITTQLEKLEGWN